MRTKAELVQELHRIASELELRAHALEHAPDTDDADYAAKLDRVFCDLLNAANELGDAVAFAKLVLA